MCWGCIFDDFNRLPHHIVHGLLEWDWSPAKIKDIFKIHVEVKYEAQVMSTDTFPLQTMSIHMATSLVNVNHNYKIITINTSSHLTQQYQSKL
jgi:hypothetical protein